ncbi:MAG: N-acetyltransferase [Gammaproteobacteria bacterium]|nr:MAG: N-acetyltransferase [Gammaproteobacteria bacterium]
MQEPIIRQETPADAEAIDVVHRAAFGGEAESRLAAALRRSEAYVPELSLVAEVEGRVTGFLMLFKAALEREGGETLPLLALAPLAVVPSQSHRGVGSALVRAALARAERLGHPAVVVVGHPDYFARFGFEPASRWGIQCPLPVPPSAVSAKELRRGALEGGGLLRYPEPFVRFFQEAPREGQAVHAFDA